MGLGETTVHPPHRGQVLLGAGAAAPDGHASQLPAEQPQEEPEPPVAEHTSQHGRRLGQGGRQVLPGGGRDDRQHLPEAGQHQPEGHLRQHDDWGQG